MLTNTHISSKIYLNEIAGQKIRRITDGFKLFTLVETNFFEM